jgi:hypothetical protein
MERAGGIGWLPARSEISNLESPHSYYHADGNGNVACLVNSNNIVVARYSCDPYGGMLGMSGPMAEVNLHPFSSKECHERSGFSSMQLSADALWWPGSRRDGRGKPDAAWRWDAELTKP